MAAAMTDHIQNNPFGRSTDGHRDDWSAVQIGGSVCLALIEDRSRSVSVTLSRVVSCRFRAL